MYTKKEVITFYYADDGKVFTDKEECQKYEKRRAKNFKVRVWDETFEELSFNENCNFNDVWFFKCETEEDFDLFKEIFPADYEYYPSEKTKLFFYSERFECFTTIEKYSEFCEEVYRIAKEKQKEFDMK